MKSLLEKLLKRNDIFLSLQKQHLQIQRSDMQRHNQNPVKYLEGLKPLTILAKVENHWLYSQRLKSLTISAKAQNHCLYTQKAHCRCLTWFSILLWLNATKNIM